MSNQIHITGDLSKARITSPGIVAEVDLNGALIETTGQPKRYNFEELLTMEVAIEYIKELRREKGIE